MCDQSYGLQLSGRALGVLYRSLLACHCNRSSAKSHNAALGHHVSLALLTNCKN